MTGSMEELERRLLARKAFGLFGSHWHMLDAPDADCVEAADALSRQAAEIEQMRAALVHVREIIKDGAMTGFNWQDGDWAERLFASQAVTHAALAPQQGAAPPPAARDERERWKPGPNFRHCPGCDGYECDSAKGCAYPGAMVAEERERCARIAEEFTDYTGRGSEDHNTLVGMFARGNRNASRKIAAAIRTGQRVMGT